MGNLKFRIRLMSDAIIRNHDTNGNLFIPGNSIKGQLRFIAQDRLNVNAETLGRIFGNKAQPSKISLKDIYCDCNYVEIPTVHINGLRQIDDNSMSFFKAIPAKSVLIGEVDYDSDLNETEILILKSSIISLENIGIGRESYQGYGHVMIEIIND